MNPLHKIGIAVAVSSLLATGQAGATIITDVAVTWNTVVYGNDPFSVITYETGPSGGFGFSAPQVTYVVGSSISQATGIDIVRFTDGLTGASHLRFEGVPTVISLSDYVEFEVTPAAGYALDPGRFAMASAPNFSPGLDYELRTSLDDYSSVISAVWGASKIGCCYYDLNADLTSLPLITEATTFRLYFQENDGTVGAVSSTASWPYGFRIYGGIDDAPPTADDEDTILQTVPEPASIVLLGLGLAALGFTRRQAKA